MARLRIIIGVFAMLALVASGVVGHTPSAMAPMMATTATSTPAHDAHQPAPQMASMDCADCNKQDGKLHHGPHKAGSCCDTSCGFAAILPQMQCPPARACISTSPVATAGLTGNAPPILLPPPLSA